MKEKRRIPGGIDLDVITRWLDHGEIKKIANREGISYRQVFNILSGKNKNFSFLEKLIEAAEHNMRLAERTNILRENLKLIQ